MWQQRDGWVLCKCLLGCLLVCPKSSVQLQCLQDLKDLAMLCCALLYKFLLKVLIHSLKLQVSSDRVSWKATPLFWDIKELVRSLKVSHTGGWRVMQSITTCLTAERWFLETEHWSPNQILRGFTWGVPGCLLEMVIHLLPGKGRLNGWGFEFKKELGLMEDFQMSFMVKGRKTWSYNSIAIWKLEHTQLSDWV